MRTSCLVAAATLTLATASSVEVTRAMRDSPRPTEVDLRARQDGGDSACSVFGIDFQGGGSYFINSNSNDNFTLVAEFEGCQNDTADIILVNEQTSDEYECSRLPTVPDDTRQMSTCPVLKGQMSSGNWSILTLGNNGNGDPFSYQRDFTLQVGPQQTVTTTVHAPYTLTLQSTSTLESTSTVFSTSQVPSNSTASSAATGLATFTPPTVTISKNEMVTRPFYRWTKTASTAYILVVVPTCTVPKRPAYADPWLRVAPTIISLPDGVQPHKPLGDPNQIASAPCDKQYCPRHPESGMADLSTPARVYGRAADAPTVTSTTTVPSNSTTTVTAGPMTVTLTDLVTDTVYSTFPPQTIYAAASSTVTAPAPTQTYVNQIYTRSYLTKTMYIVWTDTVTTTPSATATSCKRAGGHFESGWIGQWYDPSL
ncbi:hypothetical protein LTR91_013763 [Friedmanniomyces endolithicus]|uniref:Ubiquitin 3 binding protein But2 C-terminal domain-containing protein n=1 Tax=Friedmanniomyces endolithicus TaxID=329885 RepID=A0AAN6KCV6_9PEZI|nr:hypothetical protein LTR87_011026 [Friedmanniomyces endolithicus]KAK0913176.1 hypothetical protein LTR57_014512 [Friedmanniomyces endolithicus]KAK0976059.1 hypothetical protein LTR91_013763 [Friedmanniomyces endolithicus]KAK0978988.1 hypothetical protein LTS01_012509 [Friedmanniomyces endolithicus]KAK1025070.1 hypothetical protein LTS16_023519 [Friedmanniomyces endolithicus]